MCNYYSHSVWHTGMETGERKYAQSRLVKATKALNKYDLVLCNFLERTFSIVDSSTTFTASHSKGFAYKPSIFVL